MHVCTLSFWRHCLLDTAASPRASSSSVSAWSAAPRRAGPSGSSGAQYGDGLRSEVGVDLSVLQSFLTHQDLCQEEDEPWDVEHELQTIASELQKEREARDGTALTGPVLKKGKAAQNATPDKVPPSDVS